MLPLINKKKAIEKVRKKHPDLTIRAITSYDSKYWIVVATPDRKDGHMDPYYAVDKTTGQVFYFAPDDLVKFGQAMQRAEKIGI